MSSEKLQGIMDRFMCERIECGAISSGRIAHYHIHLIGSSVPSTQIGFIRFLRSTGKTSPTLNDFSSHEVGRYWEFLMQHCGGIQAAKSMKVLRIFWCWCERKGYVQDEMPADCKYASIGVKHPFEIKVTFRQF